MKRNLWIWIGGILFFCAVAYADSIGVFDAIKLRPGTLPAVGKNGELRIDSGDSNKLKKYNESNSSWEEISGSGGSAGINYFLDYQADSYATYLTAFDDGAGVVDGTGGSPTYMVAGEETSSFLSGPGDTGASYKMTKGAGNAIGEGVSFVTDTPDRTSTVGGETVYLTFNYATGSDYDNSTSGNQASVYIYRIGDNDLQSCSARDVLSGSFTNAIPVAPNGGQYQCAFTMTSSTTSVRVILGWTGTGSNATSIIFDKITVGPSAVVTAPIVTEWQSGTMSITGSVSNPTKATTNDEGFFYRRNGDSLELSYFYRHTVNTGAAAGSGVYRFNFPSEVSCTLDTTKVETSNGGLYVVGTAAGYFGGSDNMSGVAALSGSGSYIQLSIGNNASGDQTIGSSFNPITGATVYYAFKASVPCQEYANANAILSTTQADFRNLKAILHMAGNQIISGATSAYVELDEETKDTHNICSGTSCVIPKTGWYKISGAAYATGLTLEAAQLNIKKNRSANVVSYLRDVTDTGNDQFEIAPREVLLTEGDTIELQLEFASDTNWTIVDSNTTTYMQIESADDIGSTFSVYGPYEYTEALNTADVTATTSGTVYDSTGGSISVSPGTWQLCQSSSLYHNWVTGTSVGQACKTFIRDSSNNHVGADVLVYGVFSSDDDNMTQATANCVEVTTTTAKTYKLSFQCSSSATAVTTILISDGFAGAITTPDTEVRISARRMK